MAAAMATIPSGIVEVSTYADDRSSIESPNEWKPITIGELIDRNALYVKNGYPQGNHNSSGSGVPHLRPFNVSESGDIDLSQIKSVPAPADDSPYWVRRGDIIFNNTNSEELVGKTALLRVDGRFVLSNHMTILRVRDETAVDPYWLSMAFFHLWRERVFQAMCRRHVNQASVSLQRIRSLKLRLPPLAEQRGIARVLRTVQESRRATEKVIAATRQLKQSLMRHLFTYGPVPFDQADKVELKETEAGTIPAHWDVVSLESVCEFLQYGTSKRCELQPKGTPVLRIPNVIGDSIDLGELKYIELDQKETNKLRLGNGDLLFVRTNGQHNNVGRCAIYNGEPPNSLFASYLIRSRLRADQVLPQFVQIYTRQPAGQRFLSGRASRASDGKFNINTQILKAVMLPRPDLDEQREVVRNVEAVEKVEAAGKQKLNALDALFQTLLHNLMTGRIRVNAMKLAESGASANA